MKLLFILMLFPMLTIGQKKFDHYIDRQIKAGIDSIQLQISATNYCLNQYRKEKLIGTSAQVVGFGLVFFGINDKINGNKSAQEEFEYRTIVVGSASGTLEQQLINLRKAERDYYDTVDRNQNIVTIGSVVALSGTILNITAHRWLKKSYILPAEHGIGIMIKF
jgi:hypothetical protein